MYIHFNSTNSDVEWSNKLFLLVLRKVHVFNRRAVNLHFLEMKGTTKFFE